MRIAILHTRLSGYFISSLRALKRRTGAELLIYAWPNQPDAPFDTTKFSDLGKIENRYDLSNSDIEKTLREFEPDAILTSGWADRGYMQICQKMRKFGVPVIAGCDNQWSASRRQIFASMTAGMHVRRWIDILWVPGERQAVFAKALGYSGNHLWDGYYSCDWSSFAAEGSYAHPRIVSRSERRFLFVGRYVDEKGIDTLAQAYRRYTDMVSEPWQLVCAGTGPLAHLLRDAGADDQGFVQPHDLPKLLQRANAFILPSRFEPWGVVVHEAATSGLPLILSDSVGAGVHLLRQDWNGYSFTTGSADSLADMMVEMHELSEKDRQRMGRNSFILSKQYTPERWAKVFSFGLRRLMADQPEICVDH